MKCWIVMPARNEARTIGGVIDGLHREGWKNIIVVDDGSTDGTAEIARAKGTVVVSHERNLGLGAALRTGLEEALRRGADCAVTFDADGQHDPKEVRRMVEAIDGADLVIGSRRFVNVPLNKRFGNFMLNLITRLMGGPLLDSQSGMRAFSRRALETIKIRSDRYEVSSEIVINARRNDLRIREVPVKCYFTDYSKARGTTIASGIRIFLRLIKLRALYG
ncbi:MAG: glycosyltransferase family 2 protein [Candidatus Hadarchaeum sp.]